MRCCAIGTAGVPLVRQAPGFIGTAGMPLVRQAPGFIGTAGMPLVRQAKQKLAEAFGIRLEELVGRKSHL